MPTLETALQRSFFAAIPMPNSDMPKMPQHRGCNAVAISTIYEYMKAHSASGMVRAENIGQLYEEALAAADKVQKKCSGDPLSAKSYRTAPPP